MSSAKKLPINSISQCKVPRTFQLLDALDRAKDYSVITYGLSDDETPENEFNHVTMENWRCTIMYDDGNAFNIFGMECCCSLKFPDEQPIIKFSEESMQHPKVKKICNEDGTLTNDCKKQIEWDGNKMSLPCYLMKVYDKIRR